MGFIARRIDQSLARSFVQRSLPVSASDFGQIRRIVNDAALLPIMSDDGATTFEVSLGFLVAAVASLPYAPWWQGGPDRGTEIGEMIKAATLKQCCASADETRITCETISAYEEAYVEGARTDKDPFLGIARVLLQRSLGDRIGPLQFIGTNTIDPEIAKGVASIVQKRATESIIYWSRR